MVRDGGLQMLERDGVIVGALEVGRPSKNVNALDVPELYIRLVLTSRRCSGDKLGDLLIEEALDLARRQGAVVVRVDCWAGHPRSSRGTSPKASQDQAISRSMAGTGRC